MSLLINSDGVLLRDLWPNGLGRTLSDHLTLAQLHDWQVVPTTFEGICDWADVVEDPTASKVIAPSGPRTSYASLWAPTYQPPGPASRRHRIQICLHGFLGSFNIHPLGTWNGRADHAKKAVQFLTLHAYGYNAAFEPQIDCMHNIDQLIVNSLRLGNCPPERTRGVINLRCRVFDRVSVTSPAIQAAVGLSSADRVLMRPIQHEWQVNHRLALGSQRVDGSVRRAKEFVFGRGDFVEVAAYADIVSYWDTKSRSRKADIQYAPHEIIRLWSAVDARAKVAHSGQAPSSLTIATPDIVDLNTTYDLDGQLVDDANMPDLSRLNTV